MTLENKVELDTLLENRDFVDQTSKKEFLAKKDTKQFWSLKFNQLQNTLLQKKEPNSTKTEKQIEKLEEKTNKLQKELNKLMAKKPRTGIRQQKRIANIGRRSKTT